MKDRSQGASRPGRVIRASEIAEYVYCHRAWWLGRVKGFEKANRAALDEGIARHRAHGERVRRAERLRQAAFLFAGAAVILAGVLAFFLAHAH